MVLTSTHSSPSRHPAFSPCSPGLQKVSAFSSHDPDSELRGVNLHCSSNSQSESLEHSCSPSEIWQVSNLEATGSLLQYIRSGQSSSE